MPDPITHATAATVKYTGYGVFGAIVALLFDVPPPVVIAAIIGALFAVMMLHVIKFHVAAFLFSSGTFGASYLTPFIFDYVQISQKGIAAVTAFCLIYFWGVIQSAFKKALASKIEGIAK